MAGLTQGGHLTTVMRSLALGEKRVVTRARPVALVDLVARVASGATVGGPERGMLGVVLGVGVVVVVVMVAVVVVAVIECQCHCSATGGY